MEEDQQSTVENKGDGAYTKGRRAQAGSVVVGMVT